MLLMLIPPSIPRPLSPLPQPLHYPLPLHLLSMISIPLSATSSVSFLSPPIPLVAYPSLSSLNLSLYFVLDLFAILLFYHPIFPFSVDQATYPSCISSIPTIPPIPRYHRPLHRLHLLSPFIPSSLLPSPPSFTHAPSRVRLCGSNDLP